MATRSAKVAGRLTTEQERAAVRALRRFERRCYTVAVTDDVLARRPTLSVERVRMLDAVHLATIELLDDPRSPVTVVSRDVRVHLNAEGLGFQVE